MGDQQRGGRRTKVVVLLWGLALAIVAIAALMPKVFPFRRGSEPVAIVKPDTPLVADILLVALIAVLVIAALMVQVSVRRGSYATPLARRRSVWAQIVIVIVVLWSAAMLGTLLSGNRDRREDPSAQSGETPLTEVADLPPERTSRVLGLMITGGLLTLVAGSSALLYYIGRFDRGRSGGDATATAMADEMALASADISSGEDPRTAVIACYERLTIALRMAGLEPRASDAPFELISRALADLAVPAASARRLATLFELARFSDRDVDESMRTEAVEALDEVRGHLERAE